MRLNYFGTDGIRGRAFDGVLSLESVHKWGAAWLAVAKDSDIKKLVIGWDGRTSCSDLLQAFLAGFGGEIETIPLGIVPTPAVAWITSRQKNAWGLVLSASHNPPEDNGIKGFDCNGTKLSENIELSIETAYEALISKSGASVTREKTKEITIKSKAMNEYIAHLPGIAIPDSFPVVIDCAHGAVAPWAGHLFKGAVQWLGTPVDGKQINVGVGSMHLDALREQVVTTKAVAGIAFDGDGDRCLLLDDKGALVDGDQMLWLLAQELFLQGNPPPGVIGTLMSNWSLEQSLMKIGIPFIRTAVGDKYMLRELHKTGWGLAAEASGHIIQRHIGPSGDGLATALAVLRILIDKPSETRWSWRFAPWPSKLVNIKTQHRRDLNQCPTLQEVINELQHVHGNSLRLVIRWSGTEPLLRLMAEAKESWRIERALERLTAAVRADLLI